MTWCFQLGSFLPKSQLSFVEKWPLMNQNEFFFLMFTYFSFSLLFGPQIMSKRNPFKLKYFLIFYNAMKVVNSFHLSVTFFHYMMQQGFFPKFCEHDSVTVHSIAVMYWKYMITKVLDLVDTILFVLRKKYKQLTFLHLYHHSFMVIMVWICLKYDPSDHWVFMAWINSIVHIVMYMYYAIAALGPRYAKYLWWKKYLTMLQMIQFFLVFSHIIIQSYTSACPMKPITLCICSSSLVLFIVLFSDFYKKTYTIKNATFACVQHGD